VADIGEVVLEADPDLLYVKILFPRRSEEHTSELQSPVPISYAVFCLTKKNRPRLG